MAIMISLAMHAIIKTAHQNSFRNKLNNSHYSYIQGRHHAKGTKKNIQ